MMILNYYASHDGTTGAPSHHVSGAVGIALYCSGYLVCTEHQLYRHILSQLSLPPGGRVHDWNENLQGKQVVKCLG